ncbi:MAG: DNA-binding protein [Nitrospirae bacterium]|nr:DNA-binding protein [Nitrospirota bacterium]
MKKMYLSLVVLFVLVLSWTVARAADTENPPAPQAAPETSLPKKEKGPSLAGKVIETMTSGGYTYVMIDREGQKIWVAVPATVINVGQEVSFASGVEMGPFVSKTLNKKFDNIFFSTGLIGPAPDTHGTSMTEGDGAGAASSAEIKVKKAEGPNAYTINELIAKSADLDKQPIVVSGKVVKVSEAIMGKNWVHIKDGSGSPKEKLVVTSKDLPKVGDIVTVSGILYKDKDFGGGYKYSVIVEEATIK